MRSLTSLPEGVSLTAGGNLYLYNPTTPKPAHVQPVFPLIMGDKVVADGLCQKLISQKGKVLKVQSFGSKEVTYLVHDGYGKCSHGGTMKEAKESLRYKIGNRDTTRYQGLKLESILPLAEAIEAYRVITGSCEAGVRAFFQRKLPNPAKSYTIAQVISLTAGEYGGESFKAFFMGRR